MAEQPRISLSLAPGLLPIQARVELERDRGWLLRSARLHRLLHSGTVPCWPVSSWGSRTGSGLARSRPTGVGDRLPSVRAAIFAWSPLQIEQRGPH
jgi:hypothetical protein